MTFMNIPCPSRTNPPIEIISSATSLAPVKNTWTLAAHLVSYEFIKAIVTKSKHFT